MGAVEPWSWHSANTLAAKCSRNLSPKNTASTQLLKTWQTSTHSCYNIPKLERNDFNVLLILPEPWISSAGRADLEHLSWFQSKMLFCTYCSSWWTNIQITCWDGGSRIIYVKVKTIVKTQKARLFHVRSFHEINWHQLVIWMFFPSPFPKLPRQWGKWRRSHRICPWKKPSFHKISNGSGPDLGKEWKRRVMMWSSPQSNPFPKKWYFGVTLVETLFFCWLFIYHCIMLRWISSTFFNHHWYYCMFHLQVAKWWRLDSRYPPGHLWKNLKSQALSVLIDSKSGKELLFGEKWVRVDSRSWTSKTHVYDYIKMTIYNDDIIDKWKHCVCVCVCFWVRVFKVLSWSVKSHEALFKVLPKLVKTLSLMFN